MSLFKKYLSYLSVIQERTYTSAYNGTLEINWINGKKVLDTENTNYSYGNLGLVLNKALNNTTTPFLDQKHQILILGMGGGDVIKQLRNTYQSKANITAVEIDPVIIEIAINEFGIVPNQSLHIIKDDAELFVKYSKQKFDLIIVDLFNDTEIPQFLFQTSFINSLNKIANENSSLIFNTFILNTAHENRNNKFVKLLEEFFTLQTFKNLYGHNHLIIAAK